MKPIPLHNFNPEATDYNVFQLRRAKNFYFSIRANDNFLIGSYVEQVMKPKTRCCTYFYLLELRKKNSDLVLYSVLKIYKVLSRSYAVEKFMNAYRKNNWS